METCCFITEVLLRVTQPDTDEAHKRFLSVSGMSLKQRGELVAKEVAHSIGDEVFGKDCVLATILWLGRDTM